MTDLIAELAEVVSQLRSYDDKSVVGVRLSALSESAVQFIRAHHVELTRILTDDEAIRAAHHDLVIRLGEVTTELEAARKDAARYRWLRDAEPDAAWTHAYYELGGVAQPEHVDAAIDDAMKESAND